jgi:hypothetical protein
MCRYDDEWRVRMTTGHTGDGALPPELEAIAAAAHDRLHALMSERLAP